MTIIRIAALMLAIDILGVIGVAIANAPDVPESEQTCAHVERGNCVGYVE